MKKQKLLIAWVGMALCVGMLLILAGCGSSDDEKSPTGTSAPTPTPTVLPANVLIDDPLTNGQAKGFTAGGQFIAGQGYKVTEDEFGYIQYETGVRGDIKIEFDAQGYIPRSNTSKAILVQVYDSPHNFAWVGNVSGPYSQMELRKRGWCRPSNCADRVDGGETKFVSHGRWSKEYRTWKGDSPAGHPLSWDSNKKYHWEITIKSTHSSMVRDGQLIFDIPFSFNPSYNLNVRIGGVPYTLRNGPKNVTYSNVRISKL